MNQFALPNVRMTTGIERVFRMVSRTPDIYQEFTLHLIHKLAPDGTKLSSKLDKTIPGAYYKEAGPNEHSMHGEVRYVFPDGIERRLIYIRSNT